MYFPFWIINWNCIIHLLFVSASSKSKIANLCRLVFVIQSISSVFYLSLIKNCILICSINKDSMIIIYILLRDASTAIEQAVVCVPVAQRVRIRSPVGASFLGEVFFRCFFSPVRQMSGSYRPAWFPEYHLAIIIILIISTLLELMSEWMVCSCYLGGGPGIELMAHIHTY